MVKLRVEVLTFDLERVQVEEFELTRDAEDVLTTANTQITGSVRITGIGEYPIADNGVPAGKIPRRL